MMLFYAGAVEIILRLSQHVFLTESQFENATAVVLMLTGITRTFSLNPFTALRREDFESRYLVVANTYCSLEIEQLWYLGIADPHLPWVPD
jgi:hypothetical protein